MWFSLIFLVSVQCRLEKKCFRGQAMIELGRGNKIAPMPGPRLSLTENKNEMKTLRLSQAKDKSDTNDGFSDAEKQDDRLPSSRTNSSDDLPRDKNIDSHTQTMSLNITKTLTAKLEAAGTGTHYKTYSRCNAFLVHVLYV